MGIGHDGDGDRVVMVDECGEIVNGDELLGLLALYLKEKGKLGEGNKVVVTLESNLGLTKTLEQAGIQVVRADVGDRNVLYKMVDEEAYFGGEPSGHVIFRDLARTGDGLVTALKVIEVIIASGKPLSELKKQVRLMPQLKDSLDVSQKRPWEELTQVHQAIKALEEDFGEKGRVFVRYSGTEPKLRVLIEHEDEGVLERSMSRIKQVIGKELIGLPSQ